MKTNIKNVFLNKISVLIFLSAAALLLTAFLYFCFLKAVGGYSNLDDFISGYSIWTNLNKHIDLLIPYIYSFVFFALYIPLRRFIEKLPFFVFFWQNFISRAINKAASFFLWKNEKLPFWKKAVLLFSAVFIVYLLASSGYNYLSIPPDHFHFGEKLLAYWLTADGAAQMYETFYPIHGFKDIIPGFLSKFLGDNYASGSIIGMQILYNICLIGVSLTVLSIFPFFMSLIILLPLSFIKALPFIAMIVLFKDNFAFRAYPKWLILYCIFGICLYCFEFTSGIPFTLAMLPLCIYGLFNYYKTVPQKKFFLNIGVIFLLLLLFFIIFKDFFLNNFKFILDFAKYNTAAFGNLGHDESRNLPLYVLILVSKLAYKSPVYFLLPIFAILFIKSLKNKEMSAAFFFAAMTIYLAASTSYALARFDLEMGRAQNISMCFIYLLIPAFLYFNRRHGGGVYLNFLNFYIVFMFLFFAFQIGSDFTNYTADASSERMREHCFGVNAKTIKGRFIAQRHSGLKENDYFREGFSRLNETELANFENMRKFLNAGDFEQESGEKSFLDLTNSVAAYYYLNKKPLLPLWSHVTITSPEADFIYAKKLLADLPDYVLIFSQTGTNIDLLVPPVRTNAIYRAILLSGKYNLDATNGEQVFLVKSSNGGFSQNDIEILDSVWLGARVLYNMPDAYGMSLKKLKKRLNELYLPFQSSLQNNTLFISFDKPVSPKILDFILIESSFHAVYDVYVNGRFIVKAEKNKESALVSLDVVPSYLLGEDIKNITVIFNKPKPFFDKINIKFYQRNRNRQLNEMLNS